MSALLAWLLTNSTVLAIGAGIIGALGWGGHQRLAGARAERGKQAEAEAAARDVADQVDNDIGALPAGAVRKELKSWARD
ncbi:ABC transporter permease [Mesorhizobium sp. M2C.T.Ca.TU.002.02.1.1]|uniref:ABC transporter permease n=1 Tax=Mesorhizobium sp. M2C.T.Ca.TU.002.02.1.1 TaxID=2496788 RepID=UPI000FCBD2E1|nr:ABC transporter permease [Mesorhizobium sp. M2C.T.Ca.TU.002.02.1.1]RUU57899.1 ABC transporter permease [Mesorhizobium sp. M2C.T.Ca.TU.002.02.1.1]RUU58628.1 ABC transporter permease [Mesorhizobium sp. M2C.T.Ca.TU.009.01.2.1]